MPHREFTEEIESSLQTALGKLLNTGETLYDPDRAAKEIIDYVLKADRIEDSDANRYEKYYQLTGKAVIIAEAWLNNCSRDVKHYEDTEESVKNYLTQTYGRL